MSYAINYQKHIRDYFREHPAGSASEIAAVLPKHKLKPTSAAMISNALAVMLKKGLVKKILHGTYAWTFDKVCKADALAHRDEASYFILELLRAHRHAGVHTKDIYEALATRRFNHALAGQKLRKLKTLGAIRKVGMRWVIDEDALTVSVPVYQKKPITKLRADVAFQSVPSHNIHRLPAYKIDRIPVPAQIRPQPAPKAEEITIPRPGAVPSIFD
jgi:hypothetical protein